MKKNKRSARARPRIYAGKIDLSKKVMKKIHRKNLRMRPKIYFILGSILLGTGMAGAVILAVFFINLVLFRFRIHKPFGFLILGRFGFRPFLLTFPWLPLLIALGGIIGGSALLKKYDISYKKSFLWLVIGLIASILALGFLLNKTRVNERMGRVRYLKMFYESQLNEEEKQVLREKVRKFKNRN